MKRRHRTQILACALLGSSLLVAAPAAQAGPAQAEAQVDQNIEAAKALHQEARAKYELFEYLEAIELWEKAYAKLGTEAEYASIRSAVVYNLATARSKQYGIDKDIVHLKKAKLLLERYAVEQESLGNQEDLERARKTIEEIDAELAKAEAEAEPTPSPTGPEPEREPEASLGTSETGPSRDDGGAGPGRPLMIGGAVALAVGVGGFGLMGAGFAQASSAQKEYDDLDTPISELEGLEKRGKAGNAMGIAGTVVGVVGVGAGVALLVLGAKKNKSQVSARPELAPGYAGIGIRGSF